MTADAAGPKRAMYAAVAVTAQPPADPPMTAGAVPFRWPSRRYPGQSFTVFWVH